MNLSRKIKCLQLLAAFSLVALLSGQALSEDAKPSQPKPAAVAKPEANKPGATVKTSPNDPPTLRPLNPVWARGSARCSARLTQMGLAPVGLGPLRRQTAVS